LIIENNYIKRMERIIKNIIEKLQKEPSLSSTLFI